MNLIHAYTLTQEELAGLKAGWNPTEMGMSRYHADYESFDDRFSSEAVIYARTDSSARKSARAFFARAQKRVDRITDFGGARATLIRYHDLGQPPQILIDCQYGCSYKEAVDACQ